MIAPCQRSIICAVIIDGCSSIISAQSNQLSCAGTWHDCSKSVLLFLISLSLDHILSLAYDELMTTQLCMLFYFVCYFAESTPQKACHRKHAMHSPSPPLRDVGSKSNQPTHPAIVKNAVAGHQVADNNTTASILVRPPFDKIQTHAFGDFWKPCHSWKQCPRWSEMTGNKPWFRDIRARLSRVWNGFQRVQVRRRGQSDRWMTLWKMWGESCCEDESILT